jgi:hypothetical protein
MAGAALRLHALSESCLDVPIAAVAEADVTPPLDRLLAPEKAAFLAAVDALDRDALAATLRDGLFPHSVQAAIERVSDNAALSLADKRRRMAWLLARHDALPGLSDAALGSLVAWLPAEDWGPLQRYRLCVPDGAGDRLADLARERGRADLASRLRAGAGRGCGS